MNLRFPDKGKSLGRTSWYKIIKNVHFTIPTVSLLVFAAFLKTVHVITVQIRKFL